MPYEEPFHETWENALQATVDHLGGPKRVSGRLWPTMNADSAYSKLKACLNPDKEREKLTLTEIQLLSRWGRDIGCHYSARFFMDASGYEQPEPRNVDNEKLAIERQLLDMGRQMREMFERLENLTGDKHE